MKDLKSYLLDFDFKNVATYIESGNIVLDSQVHDRGEIEKLVKACISEKFAYDISVYVYTRDELLGIQNKNPFIEKEIKSIYYAFLMDTPTLEDKAILSQYPVGEDHYHIGDKVVYVCYKSSAGQSKLNNALLERKLKVKSTMRHGNTLNKILAMRPDN